MSPEIIRVARIFEFCTQRHIGCHKINHSYLLIIRKIRDNMISSFYPERSKRLVILYYFRIFTGKYNEKFIMFIICHLVVSFHRIIVFNKIQNVSYASKVFAVLNVITIIF